MQIIEEAISAKGPLGDLNGIHAFSHSASQDVVLVIPGSGPTDLNGNNPLGVKASTYQRLAHALAENGIQCVRIDKRGMFSSREAVPDANDVTIEAYAQDVGSWIDAILAKLPSAKIWLFGHSEGGLVAMVSATKNLPISGLILAATPARNLAEIMKEQLQSNPVNKLILDDAIYTIEQLKMGSKVDVATFHPPLMQLFAPEIQNFLINLFTLDPVEIISGIETKTVILQGDRDIQVSTDDAQKLFENAQNAKLTILPDVNHVLKIVTSSDRTKNVEAYQNPELPIAPEFVNEVIGFINSQCDES